MLSIFFDIDFVNQKKLGGLIEVWFSATNPQMLLRLAGLGFAVLMKTVWYSRYCFGALDHPSVSEGEFCRLTHLGPTG